MNCYFTWFFLSSSKWQITLSLYEIFQFSLVINEARGIGIFIFKNDLFLYYNKRDRSVTQIKIRMHPRQFTRLV